MADTASKPTVASQTLALHTALGRLKQVATAYAPAFIALARGVPNGFTQPNRPGLKGVGYLVGQILVAHATNKVLLRLMVEAGMVKAEEIDALLAKQYEAEADELALAINDGSMDLHHPFRFADVPPPAPPKPEDLS